MVELNDDFLNKWAVRIAAMMKQEQDQQQQQQLFSLQQGERQPERLQTPHFDITSILNSPPMSQPPPSPQQHQLQQIFSPRPPPSPCPQPQISYPRQLTSPSPTCYVQAQPASVSTTTVCIDSSTNFNNKKRKNDDDDDDDEDEALLFSDSSEASDSDGDDPRQLWNKESKKKEYEELKRDYTKHDLRLCNRNGDVIKTVEIFSQNKNNFPVLVYEKRSFDAILNLSRSLKEKLDVKAKVIQEIYNLNQGINYIKYNSERLGKRMRSVKRRRKEK